MDGIHDMGGMHGFGPIRRDPDEALFHHDWEGRVFAIAVSAPIAIPGGARAHIENMDPAQYLTSSYYEKWLHARIEGYIAAGALTRQEIDARIAQLAADPQATPPRRDDPAQKAHVLKRIRTHVSPMRQGDTPPRYKIGDPVQVRVMHPPGHTRLPRYARGKQGTIERFYGFQDLQDALPPNTPPPPPQPLYAVRFAARTLWGDEAEEACSICIDLWESYLENPH